MNSLPACDRHAIASGDERASGGFNAGFTQATTRWTPTGFLGGAGGARTRDDQMMSPGDITTSNRRRLDPFDSVANRGRHSSPATALGSPACHEVGLGDGLLDAGSCHVARPVRAARGKFSSNPILTRESYANHLLHDRLICDVVQGADVRARRMDGVPAQRCGIKAWYPSQVRDL